LGNLSDFSRRIKPFFKFIKDSNGESVPRFLTLIVWRFGCQHNLENCSQCSNASACKLWEFFEQGKASIFNFQFEPVWIIWENTKLLGPTHQPPGPNHGATRADRVWTAAAALPTHAFTAHRFHDPRPPPHAAIRGAPRRRAPSFRPSSSAHAPPLLLLAPCQCRLPHPGPLSATSSGHPSTRPSPPRAPPRSGAPLRPFQLRPGQPLQPTPPLLPAQHAPPRIALSVSPRPPKLLQSGFFHSDVVPSPLSHRPQTSSSPESADATAQ
jgi:hypothetical protein